MKCYVINLERSPYRWQRMQAQAAASGIALNRLAAVDVQTLSAADVRQQTGTSFAGYTTSPGEIACHLSHRAAWQLIADADDAYGAIFEDDVALSPQLGAILSSPGWIPRDADIVRLESFNMEASYVRKPVAKALGRTVHLMHGHQYGLAGYILPKKGARRLLELIPLAGDPVDEKIYNPRSPVARSLVRYQLLPCPVMQDRVKPHHLRDAALGSYLQAERTVRNPHLAFSDHAPPREPKPRGWAKLWRELSRPFTLARAPARLHAQAVRKSLLKTLPAGVVLRHIPFK